MNARRCQGLADDVLEVAEFCMFLQQSSFFDERVTKPLLRRVDFLRESGGFALMSATYYFDDTEFRKLYGDRSQTIASEVGGIQPSFLPLGEGAEVRVRDDRRLTPVLSSRSNRDTPSL